MGGTQCYGRLIRCHTLFTTLYIIHGVGTIYGILDA